MIDCLVALDLETTGLSPKEDKIIEIGAVKIKNGEVIDRYDTLLNPRRTLSYKTTEITGISDEMLLGQPEFSDIRGEIQDFIGDNILLGHNILFDYSFLKRAILNDSPKGTKWDKKGIDTLKIARACLPKEIKKNLESLCSYYGIIYNAHRAGEDALASYYLYQKLSDRFEGERPEVFVSRDLIYQVKKESPVMSKQIRQMEELFKQYSITVDFDPKAMTKNEASRYIDKVKSMMKQEK